MLWALFTIAALICAIFAFIKMQKTNDGLVKWGCVYVWSAAVVIVSIIIKLISILILM
jgi:hypothetical protein